MLSALAAHLISAIDMYTTVHVDLGTVTFMQVPRQWCSSAAVIPSLFDLDFN